MKKIINDNQGNVTPLIYLILCIVAFGALYTIFFIEVCMPHLAPLIPTSDYKTYFLMLIWGIPIIITIVISLATIKSGLKRNYYGGYY